MMGYVCQRIIFYADMDNRLHQKRLHLENSPFFFSRYYPLIFRFSNSENRVKAMLEALTRKYAQDSVEDYL